MTDEDLEDTAPVDAGAPKPEDGAEADPFAELKALDAQREAEAAATAEPAPSEAPEPEPVTDSGADAANDATEAAETEPSDAELADAEPAQGADPEPADNRFRYTEKYYAPLAPDNPAGEEIEYYHFAEMEQALVWPKNDFDRPDPEQRPNFRAIRKMALDFLDGTKELKAVKDIRALLGLVVAEAGDAGPVAFAKSLDLFVANVHAFWPDLHPQKEDEDDDEMMMRMEEMRKYFSAQVIGLAVDSVAVAKSPRVGELTTRTFGIATANLSPREGEFAPDTDAINTLMEQEPEVQEQVIEAHDAYRHAIGQLQELRTFLDDHPDIDPVDLESVSATLETLDGYLAPFAGATDATEAGVEGDADGMASAAADVPVIGPKTLEEAVALMDEILAFYAARGRSSPVPLGLLAVRDLTNADFNAWIQQTAASGVAEAAINISTVDASRLAQFASGEPVAAAAPAAAAPPVDYSELDSAVANMTTAIGYLDMAIAQLPGAGESADGEAPPLSAEVDGIKGVLESIKAARSNLGTPEAAKTAETAEIDTTGPENTAEGDARHSRITSRNDVKASLDLIAAFFEREEPSSPAPGYLKRLRSLVDARFSDIARELMGEEGYEPKLRLEPRTNLR